MSEGLDKVLALIPLLMERVWLIYLFLIVFFTLLIHYLEARVYRKIKVKLEKTLSVWDEALAEAIHKPLGIMIWLYGLTYAAEYASSLTSLNPTIFLWIAQLRRIGTIVLVGWFLIRFISQVEENLTKRVVGIPPKLDKTTAHAIAHLLRLSVVITIILVILQILHIDITGVLALGGVGAIIIGVASKDLLSNFFGAFMIYLDRPFSVGDWISSPDKQIEGRVEYIGWRLTHIRTLDGRPLYVPNSVFMNISVENPSRMTNRRIKEVVGIRYSDVKQVENIAKNITDMLLNHPEVDTKKTCTATLCGFGTASLDILLYFFTKATDHVPFYKAQQDILMKVLKIIENHGAEVAYPTTLVMMPEGLKVENIVKEDRP